MIYSFQFKPLGNITKIPNSQSIFGMICYLYLQKYGKKELEEMLNRFYSGNPDFLISSFFLHNLLPTPIDIMGKHEENLTKEKLKKLKIVKKTQYISKSIFKEYLSNYNSFIDNYNENIFKNNYIIINNRYLVKKEEVKEYENILLKENMQIRNLVGRDNIEKQLFYNEVIYCNKELTFDLYVQVLNPKQNKIIELLKNAYYVSIGGSKSIGYNLYNVASFNTEHFINNNKNRILLSLATVGDEIVYDKSYYKLQTLNNKVNNARNRVYKNCITVFLEGSSINTNKSYIGSFSKQLIDGEERYSNYLGLLI